MPQQRSHESTFFFPLRTNTGYFESPNEYLSLIERMKQASLLYDHLIFEDGLYIASVWKDANHDMHIPRDGITPAMLQNSHSYADNPSGEAALYMQTPGSPAIAMHTGKTVRQFQHEFINVLQDINAQAMPWIKCEQIQLTKTGKKAAEGLNAKFAEFVELNVPPEHYYLRALIAANLSKDLVCANALGGSASLNNMFALPLLQGLKAKPADGFVALEIAVPDLSHLRWDEIAEIREQPSLLALREELCTLEQKAACALAAQEFDQRLYRDMVKQTLMSDLLEEIDELRPRRSTGLRNVILELILGLIPIPWLNTAVGMFEHEVAVQSAHASWTAALMRLRGN